MDDLILEVGIALLIVALAAYLSGKFKFSIIPFLIVLGMLVGPHAPVIGFVDLTFIQSDDMIHFLGRIGVLFLLFYLGLEFSVDKLVKSGKNIVKGGTLYVATNFILGVVYGFIIGMPLFESLIIGGMMAVSSTAIVAKVLVDLRRTGNKETELILGIILFDDLFLALFLSIMSGVLMSTGTAGSTIISVLISVGYMLLFFVLAKKGVKFFNKVLSITSNESFIIVVFAGLFFVAGFSETLHVAEAIGALLFGLMLSETEHTERMEKMVLPFRDFFGAIFFFSFGLSIDPTSLGDAIWLALGAVIITIISNFVAGMIAGRMAGLSHRASSNIGLTIMARGEFTIIVVNLGIAAGLSPMLQPISALYVLIMAILGPLAAKESGHIYRFLNKIFKWQKIDENKPKKPRMQPPSSPPVDKPNDPVDRS